MPSKKTITFHQLRKTIELSGGISIVRVKELGLMTANGTRKRIKVGEELKVKISDNLKSTGIDHLPNSLPNCLDDNVIVFTPEFPGFEALRAIQHPSGQSIDVLQRTFKHAKGNLT